MICVDSYLQSPPAWAQDSLAARYADALVHHGLVLGRNASRHCPCGGHGDSDDPNVVAYGTGLMCYSRHGFIPPRQVIALAGLTGTAPAISLADLARREVGRFVARDQLVEILRAGAEEQLGWSDRRAAAAVDSLVAWAMRSLSTDSWWARRLKVVCDGSYPMRAHEFWGEGMIVHARHHVPRALETLVRNDNCSYTVRLLVPRERPTNPLAIRLAPALAAISDEEKATVSASIDRFLAGEKHAVAQSSLVAIELIDRPVPGLRGGWRLPSHAGELPRLVDVARPTAAPKDSAMLLRDLFADLRTTFAFQDDEAFARYVAYLIQPMLVVLGPGLFPGFLFSGPTKCGKTFLGGPFPSRIFRHNAGAPVFVARFPSGDYETAVQLEAHQGALYALFDETIDMTDSQAKALDQLITSETLVTRRMHVGYLTRPNYVTFACTAVARSLPPETAARVLEIHLTESRPNEISGFFSRWRGRGAEVLRALFDTISEVANIGEGDHVPERRPGCGILRRVLREAFGIAATFEVTADDDEMLDVVCQAHFDKLGSERSGGWRRISFSALAKLYTENTHVRATKKSMAARIYTALGHESTRQHPVYRHGGYRWEDGRGYEIEIRRESEGGAGQRSSVYVRELKPSSSSPGEEPARAVPPPSVRSGTEPRIPAVPAAAAGLLPGTVEFEVDALERELLSGGDQNG